MVKLQSDIDKMQNIVNTLNEKAISSLPEFYFPEMDDEYYYIDMDDMRHCCVPFCTNTVYTELDFPNIMLGNTFRTEEECKIEVDLLILFLEIKEKALKENQLVAKGQMFVGEVDNYYIVYDYELDKIYPRMFSRVYQQGIIPNCFFKTLEFTEEVIKEYETRIKVLLNKKYRKGTE